MRQILVHSRTSDDWCKRDCCVTEHMRQADALTTVTRRCTYRVEGRVTVPSTSDSIVWAKNLDPLPPRQVFVTKDLDLETGAERVIYKILGHFYVVLDREIFCISYRHVLSMSVDMPEPSCGS